MPSITDLQEPSPRVNLMFEKIVVLATSIHYSHSLILSHLTSNKSRCMSCYNKLLLICTLLTVGNTAEVYSISFTNHGCEIAKTQVWKNALCNYVLRASLSTVVYEGAYCSLRLCIKVFKILKKSVEFLNLFKYSKIYYGITSALRPPDVK